MMHPQAELARQAMASQQFSEAERILRSALALEPSNPDLFCEALILQCFAMQEKASARDFKGAKGAQREDHLRQILSQHFYCLTKLNQRLGKKDAEAEQFAKAFPVSSTAGLGINLSAVLIVKNEERWLEQCLASLKGIVDEIVVVDTGSTDRTVEIATAHGAVLGYHQWNADFSAARNKSLELATGEWALWIDADEALVPESLDAIHKAIVRPHYGGFNLEIINFIADEQQDEQFVHTLLRLFRRIPGVKFVEPIHEQVLPSLHAMGLPWAHLPGARLLHYGYQPSVMLEKNKTDRTIGMVEARLQENPHDYFQWFNLTNALIVAKEFERTVPAAKKCIELMPPDVEFGPLVYQVLVTALLELKRYDEALQVADQADANGCGGILVEFERTNVYINQRDLSSALDSVEKTLAMTWPANLAGDKGIETFKRHALKGQILSEMGRNAEALDWMEQAIERAPNQPNLKLNRGLLLEKLGRIDEALDAFLDASRSTRIKTEALIQLGRLAKSTQRYKVASAAYQDLWRLDSTNSDAWGLAVECLEAAGDWTSAINAYEDWAAHNAVTTPMKVNWARALEQVGNADAALAKYQEVFDQDPENANALFSCGDLLYRCQAYRDAVGVYQRALQLEPLYADGWFVFGNALAQLNFNDAAAKCYEEVLRLSPMHAGARNNLSVVTAA